MNWEYSLGAVLVFAMIVWGLATLDNRNRRP